MTSTDFIKLAETGIYSISLQGTVVGLYIIKQNCNPVMVLGHVSNTFGATCIETINGTISIQKTFHTQ